MRYVMFTFVDPADAATYEQWPQDEKDAFTERHIAWFRRHGDRIEGGAELAEPATVKSLRPGRQGEGVVITDGPFVETKEVLGGVIILEADDMDAAVAIAASWPTLDTLPNSTVQVQPVFARD